LEYTLATKSKPVLTRANPVTLSYDALYDAGLRREADSLKARVANVERDVNNLKKDSDGDGVSDQFDKCPNTPAGTVVDGAGCPIIFPKPPEKISANSISEAYQNIQFDFNSSELKKNSWPVLDATAADLKANGNKVFVVGYDSQENYSAAYSGRLSRDRANSVKIYLVNSGVNPKQLRILARGETHPIADNSTEGGKIVNRRVEFQRDGPSDIPDEVFIDFVGGKAALKGYEVINSWGKYLKSHSTATILLIGHFSIGETHSFKQIANERVKNVKEYLIKQFSIKGSRIQSKQFSTEDSERNNQTAGGQIINQSVEVEILTN
jgi:OOP family OmpA-OmpF porin